MHFLDTFESFLRQQQLDTQPLTPEAEPILRAEYERRRRVTMAHDPRTLFRKPCKAGEYRYAVAIADGADLWLTLVIRRGPRGDCYVLVPRDSTPWNPHASYHHDGTYHHKSNDMELMSHKRQPLQGFAGTQHLGSYFGHGVGNAICYPAAFTSVLTIPTGILEGTRGCVLVDLVEPGVSPSALHRDLPGRQIVKEETFRDCAPWVVVAVAAQAPLTASLAPMIDGSAN